VRESQWHVAEHEHQRQNRHRRTSQGGQCVARSSA